MQSIRIYEMPDCKMVSSGIGMVVPPELEIIDFQGGFYAVATDIDQKTDAEFMKTEMDKFLSENGFERDTSRPELGNIITSPHEQEILGYEQMDYYIPVKAIASID